MFSLAIKKLFKNKWLIISLFAGILLAVLIACSIPMYSAGIAQRMFLTRMENYQAENDRYPTIIRVSGSLTSFGQPSAEENFKFADKYMNETVFKSMQMKTKVKSTCISSNLLFVCDSRYASSPRSERKVQSVYLRALNDYSGNIQIVEGKLPSDTLDGDGCVEVMLSRVAQRKLLYAVGTEMHVDTTKDTMFTSLAEDPVKIKIVGVFDYTPNVYSGLVEADTGEEMYCNYNLAYNSLLVERGMFNRATWYYMGDYSSFNVADAQGLLDSLEDFHEWVVLYKFKGAAATIVPPVGEISAYINDAASANALLVVFYAPIMILLILFIFMITKLVIDNDKNEIAMLNSRGASRGQIISVYLFQGAILSVVSCAAAPVLALLLCRLLGVTSGFMEFGQRAPMMLSLSWETVLWGIGAAVLAMITMLVPAYFASKTEIVEFKRAKVKKQTRTAWTMLISAVLLAVVSVYGYYSLVVQGIGLQASNGSVQPLAYLLLMAFFSAVGLFFLIVYPLVLKRIYKKKSSKWVPERYSAFSRISNMQGREKFVVVFLIMTIALGVFSATSARTLNVNMDDHVKYEYGCDMIVETSFEISGTQIDGGRQRPFIYSSHMTGIDDAMKVITGKNPTINSRQGTLLESNVQMMGINANHFAKMVWWRNGILPQHINTYLNMLSTNLNGCIISENTSRVLNVNVGDKLSVLGDASLPMSKAAPVTVLAVVDAWPTYYPQTENANGVSEDNYLVVLNSQYLESRVSNLPYQAWLKTNEDLDVKTLRREVLESNGRIKQIIDGAAVYENSQFNAIRQAANGSLTLGFLAVITICLIGFVIYWIISVKSRTLQIGTMRALGMPAKAISRMVLWEQGLLCVPGVLVGILLGSVSGWLFLPVLQSVFGERGQIPPFRVVNYTSDFLKVYAFIVILVAVSTAVAIYMLKRIKASSAIKLGEE